MNRIPRQQPGAKRDLVLCSWLRSQGGRGLDTRTHAPSVAQDEFRRILGGSDRLRGAAGELLQRTRAMLDTSDAIVLLCDPGGVVIEVVGGAQGRRRGERNNLQPGGCWSESAIGTNAIGTALHLRRPVTISDDEHFCAAIRHWACAAVPLHDPLDGRLLGAIDISGTPGAGFGNAGALATALAAQIEASLRDADLRGHRELIGRLLDSRPRRQGDEMMLLDRFGRLVWASDAFERCAAQSGLPAPEALRQLAAQREGDAERAATLLRDRLPGADIDVLGDPGAALGLVVTLPPAPARRRPAPDATEGLTLDVIAAASPTLAPLCAAARKFHDRAIALTIEGPPGTGKSTFARALHGACGGPTRPFETLDCAALDAETLRRDLREGSGPLRQGTRGGALCLSEPAHTPAEAQPLLAQLLDRLTERSVAPVRLIALASAPLAEAVRQGRLCRELQLRCAGAVIRLPALAERRDEIGPLVQHFARLCAPAGRRPLRFSPAAFEALRRYDWPGNLWEMRDLLAALETGRAEACTRVVEPADLPADIRASTGPTPLRLHESEKTAILNAVAAADGNLSRAARRLGIARSTLYLKLDQYGLRRPPRR